jgi:TPR repeat protein
MRKVAVAVALLVTAGLATRCQQASTPATARINEKSTVADLRARAERGEAEAQFNLGVRYVTGEGVSKDHAQAVAWFRRAAELGDAEAQRSLGVMYGTGKGVAQDHTQAAAWLRKAAEQGDAEAQFNLGLCYEFGNGVSQDTIEAHKWLTLAAAALGDLQRVSAGSRDTFVLAAARAAAELQKRSGESLDTLAQKMSPAQIAEAQKRAREWTEAFARRQKK